MGPRKYYLYEEENSGIEEKTHYEVIKVPLQDHVASVRKPVSGVWNNIKVYNSWLH